MGNSNSLQFLLMGGLILLAACICNGCQGAKGDLGPSGAGGTQGPQGIPTAPIYYYNSSFDTQTDLSEWTVYQAGGLGSIDVYLDATAFNSPGKSMGVSTTGTVFGDSFVYKRMSFDTTKDIWVEFDWLLQGMAGDDEVVLNVGTQINKVSIGYDSTNLFLTHNGIKYYPAPSISASLWHHVKMKYDAATGLSSYWLDGLSIGTNYNTAIYPSGSPPAGNFLGHKIFFCDGCKAHLDNVTCYHY